MRWPSKRWRGGYPMHDLQHYIARITDRKDGCYVMTAWPWNWRKLPRPAGGCSDDIQGTLFLNIEPTTPGTTTTGRLHVGAPVELWAWLCNGKPRIHLRSLWVRL